MSRARRVPAGRRTGRSQVRLRPDSRRARTAGGSSRTAGLTTRAAVLGLVLCGLVVSAALPLREYLSQRSRIDVLQSQQAAQRDRVLALEQERGRLDDPAHVAALARERLHFLRPGETAYVLLDPAPAPEPDAQAPAAGEQSAAAPWYSQLHASLVAADRPPAG